MIRDLAGWDISKHPGAPAPACCELSMGGSCASEREGGTARTWEPSLRCVAISPCGRDLKNLTGSATPAARIIRISTQAAATTRSAAAAIRPPAFLTPTPSAASAESLTPGHYYLDPPSCARAIHRTRRFPDSILTVVGCHLRLNKALRRGVSVFTTRSAKYSASSATTATRTRTTRRVLRRRA